MKSNLMLIGGFFGLTAVLLGAMGAHALKAMISANQLDSFEVGVKYQMYHALAIILVSFINQSLQSKLLQYSIALFTIGTLLFSGSIYLLATKNVTGLENIQWLGPVTPIGGSLLIVGWALIMIKGFQDRKN